MHTGPNPKPRVDSRLRGALFLAAAGFASLAVLGAQHEHGAMKPQPAKAAGAKTTTPAAQNSCSVCLERGGLVNPNMYANWNDPDVKLAYAAAQKYPATLDLIHCFCECKESPREHHKTLLTCFTNEHAAGCGICQHEAILAAKLKDQGASDEEVEYTVESLHKTDGHPPTRGRGI